jgi:2,4-dienoyl-CoA reductase-like NADH-dependent reductase (Old Yellow Enzyme family)
MQDISALENPAILEPGGAQMRAGEYMLKRAREGIDSGRADLTAFGRPYIANPDLVERFRNGWPLAVANRETCYSGDDRGYTDFQSYAGSW